MAFQISGVSRSDPARVSATTTITGPPGAPGLNGAPGTPGRDGIIGRDGAPGLVQSVNGKSATNVTLAASDVGAAATGRTAISDANYTIARTDVYVAMTALSSARTITLPSAATFAPGQPLYIADESGNAGTYTITIAAAGSDLIAGQSSASMTFGYQKLIFHSNGSNLWTVA